MTTEHEEATIKKECEAIASRLTCPNCGGGHAGCGPMVCLVLLRRAEAKVKVIGTIMGISGFCIGLAIGAWLL